MKESRVDCVYAEDDCSTVNVVFVIRLLWHVDLRVRPISGKQPERSESAFGPHSSQPLSAAL